MKVASVGKFVLVSDPNSRFYLRIGHIVDVTNDETGIPEIKVRFYGPMKGPWGMEEHIDEIKCDFYDFQNQFKILKFED